MIKVCFRDGFRREIRKIVIHAKYHNPLTYFKVNRSRVDRKTVSSQMVVFPNT